MSSVKAEKVLYALLVIIAVAALTGTALLVSQAQSTKIAIIELTAFSVSIIAVILAVLGMITNIHQVRTVRRIARDIKVTVRDLKDIDKDNEVIKRKINQDYALSREIAEALIAAGIIEGEEKKQAAQSTVEQKIRKRSNQSPKVKN